MTAHPLLDSAAAQAVGTIASALPGATAVFRRFKIDFCCGGGTALAEAAAARGVDVKEVIAALAAIAPAADPVPAETGALIDHILVRYHETHRRDLPELIRLAHRVAAQHAGHPDAPAGLTGLLETIHTAVEEHMMKEELVLFPMMRSGGHAMIIHPIVCMRHEHDQHGENLARLAVLTRNGRLPEDACPTWRALYAGIDKFVADLTEHVHLENNVLFPRFE